MTQPELNFFPDFEGEAYIHEYDHVRLTKQIKRIHDFLKSHGWVTLREIAFVTGDPESSISAQLRNLRKDKFGKHIIEKQRSGVNHSGLFEYRMNVNNIKM